MKKILTALMLVGLAMTSCHKDYISNPDAEDQPNSLRGKFECNINGERFVGEFKYGMHNTEDGMNMLSISAIQYDPTRRKEDSRTVAFSINYYDGPKEYQFGTEVMGQYTRTYTDQTPAYYAIPVVDENAKLNLEEFGTQTKGTFNFRVVNTVNMYDTLTISDGVFEFPIN